MGETDLSGKRGRHAIRTRCCPGACCLHRGVVNTESPPASCRGTLPSTSACKPTTETLRIRGRACPEPACDSRFGRPAAHGTEISGQSWSTQHRGRAAPRGYLGSGFTKGVYWLPPSCPDGTRRDRSESQAYLPGNIGAILWLKRITSFPRIPTTGLVYPSPQSFRGQAVSTWNGVGGDVQRGRSPGVAQARRHNRYRDASIEHLGGHEVAKVVESEVIESSLMKRLVTKSVTKVGCPPGRN